MKEDFESMRNLLLYLLYTEFEDGHIAEHELEKYEKEIFNAGYKEGRKDHIKELDTENDIQRWRKSGHP